MRNDWSEYSGCSDRSWLGEYEDRNEGVIDDYYKQMEIEANKADKRKGAK